MKTCGKQSVLIVFFLPFATKTNDSRQMHDFQYDIIYNQNVSRYDLYAYANE